MELNWQEKVTEEFQYFDPTTNSIIKLPGSTLCKPVTNYEYESKLNEEKRLLLILKPEYLSVIVTDFRNMMIYNEEDPNFINEKLKNTYNEKVMRI
jgi:AAA15 family ATPase/GTPase